MLFAPAGLCSFRSWLSQSLKFVEDCNRIKRLQKDQQSHIEPMSHRDDTGLPRNKAASGKAGNAPMLQGNQC